MEDILVRFQHYLERRNYSPCTTLNYLSDLRLFFRTVTVSVESANRRHVEVFIDQQREEGRSAATINRRLSALRHFYAFLADEKGPEQENPVRSRHRLRQPRRLPRPFKEEDLQRLFEVICDLRDQAIFSLMLRAGLRLSEVAQLGVEDVDLEKKTVFVRQGKGKRDRLVYVSEDAVELLRRCLAQRPHLKNGRLFWNHKRPGEGVIADGIQKAMERYCRKAGIKGSCHRLRHTFACHLLENGSQMVTVRDFLGHASVFSSERYAKVSNEKVREEYYRAMAKVLGQMQLNGRGEDSHGQSQTVMCQTVQERAE